MASPSGAAGHMPIPRPGGSLSGCVPVSPRRLLLRHILEHSTAALTLGNNLLLTYRINSGTVMCLGYDDRYQQGARIGDALFMTSALMRTNRAVFAKVSYLFCY